MMNQPDDQDELKSKVLGSFTLELSFSGGAWRAGQFARRRCWWTCAVACAIALSLSIDAAQSRSLAPFVGTPPDIVERMLTIAKTRPGDVVYDIGCGDGRIVIMAAQKFGARGVGIDIDPTVLARAETAAKAAGVADRVTFRQQDAMTVDVSDATVVTLYLLAASNAKLRPILTAKLAPGARIVTHNYPLGGDWEPAVIDNVTDAAGVMRTLYLWIADGRVH
jgi:SAM-dependent methyltransferase